jgi:fused signal recognition particle receptor
MFNFVKRIKQSLSRATQSLWGWLKGRALTLDSIEELEEALYGADFGVEASQSILDEVKKAFAKEKELQSQQVLEIAKTVVARLMEGAESPYQTGTSRPDVICLVGVNGAGKTTTAAKLAYRFEKAHLPVLIGACDTFRAAANEQIRLWAERLKLDLVQSQHGGDPAAVAFDAYMAAKNRDKAIVLLDTAGRLHTKDHLMEELKKIRRVLGKQDGTAPQHVWLVVDGSLGANSIVQAKAFHDAIGLTGLIVTKLDGTSRGGALVGIYQALKLPIYFVGMGESPEDLQPFELDAYLNALFEVAS